MQPPLVEGVDVTDVAVAHLLPGPHPAQPRLARRPLARPGLATLPSRRPAPAPEHLDGVRGQGPPTRLVQVVEVEVLLLQPPQLAAVRPHLQLDVCQEPRPHLPDQG